MYTNFPREINNRGKFYSGNWQPNSLLHLAQADIPEIVIFVRDKSRELPTDQPTDRPTNSYIMDLLIKSKY